MAKLRAIRAHVPLSVDEEFRAADDPRPLLEVDEGSQTNVVREDIDLEAVDGLIQRVMETYERYDTAADEAMVREFHALFPLTRREAADRRLWAWLGWVRYPHFVAWRWKPGGKTGLRTANRFVGDRVRQCFARLWWAAELTVGEGGDYGLTQQLFRLRGFQDVYEAIFGRAFSQYRPAIKAFVDVVGHREAKVVRETSKEFGYLLTTLVLETLSEADLQAVLSELTQTVERRLRA